ncbi:hypothetical protein [Nitrospira lenta]|uniref:hypothetical protein n=1 Tax=Nitrospira lenta TaxID=1436998 RepID=UPI0011B57841|nr:hypothetical protein [Nitrospira lenta]
MSRSKWVGQSMTGRGSDRIERIRIPLAGWMNMTEAEAHIHRSRCCVNWERGFRVLTAEEY